MQNRYQPRPDGRKEYDGFVTSSFTFLDPHIACVAVKMGDGSIQIRDTKDPNDTTLSFDEREWDAFIKGVKAGEFDL